MKRFFMILLMLFCSVSLGFASDAAKDLSKEADVLIRQAEKKFFSSKIDDSDALLEQAEQILEQLKTMDGGQQYTKTLQGKHDRLRKRVDEKIKKTTKTGSVASNAQDPVISSGIKPLSHGAKSNLKKANKEMDFAEQEMAKGEKSLSAGDYNLVKSYIFNMGEKLGNVESILNTVVQNNRADPNHPEVVQTFDRLQGLRAKYSGFKQQSENQKNQADSAEAAAKAGAETLNNAWVPKIKQFTDYSGTKRLQFPGLYNKSELSKQDQYLAEAKQLLADCNHQASGAALPHELSRAVKDLAFKIEVYEQERHAGSRNMAEPVKTTLNEWERRLDENNGWNPDSGKYLFVVSPQKISDQKDQIKRISSVMPDQAEKLSKQLAAIEKENSVWQKKKTAWANRPQPFPNPGMSSKKLEKEVSELLEDRGVKSKKIHIVDKEWWVLKGEYRYMNGAFLSNDSQGAFWSSFNFRQMKTLSGYGPTELWEVNSRKIRLP